MDSLTNHTTQLRAFVSGLSTHFDSTFSPVPTKFPKLTIITPSFNQDEFLERTILSVLNQGYPNLEYIIIDGGSMDNCVGILKKYESHPAYWVIEKDQGQVNALNKALARSTGEWIGF
ncbi:glycosyltransferase [Telluribacter sp.]|jgi:glycosyltransferase involved in cell wall biosynthesis|uniref:glycosyltransferase n=1 Tax=Telluribacter sp. TaxID=1978767 RepID=UPI002E13C88C|nr:glycosyltransferase [Telluribacter sp.]